MRGLILKDIFSLKKHYISNMKTVIVLTAFFILFAVGSVHGNLKGYLDFSMFLFILCGIPMLIGTMGVVTVQYDITSGFREFEIAMPVTDEKKVLAKYIVCFIYLASSAVYIIMPVICCMLSGQAFDSKVVFMYLFMMELTALYGLVFIPASLLGNDAHKTRMAVNLVIIILAMSMGGSAGFGITLERPGAAFLETIWENIGLAALILLPILAVGFAVSYFFALKAYRLKRGVITTVSDGTRPKSGGRPPSALSRYLGMK